MMCETEWRVEPDTGDGRAMSPKGRQDCSEYSHLMSTRVESDLGARINIILCMI